MLSNPALVSAACLGQIYGCSAVTRDVVLFSCGCLVAGLLVLRLSVKLRLIGNCKCPKRKEVTGSSLADAGLHAFPGGGRSSKRRRALMRLTEMHLLGDLSGEGVREMGSPVLRAVEWPRSAN